MQAEGETNQKAVSGPARWLFVSFASLYLLGLGGHIYTSDGVVMAEVTRSIVDRGEVSIPHYPIHEGFGNFGQLHEDGSRRYYAKFGLGVSLAAVPTYVLGGTLAPLAGSGERGIFAVHRQRGENGDPANPWRQIRYDVSPESFESAFATYVMSWINPLIVAGILALVFACCIELGHTRGVALAVASFAGLATPLLHYSKTFFSEPLAGLMITGSFLCLLRGARTRSLWSYLVAGLCLGAAVLTKTAHVIMLLPVGVCLAWQFKRQPRPVGWREFAASGLGFGVFALVIALYNYARFGEFTETGYGVEVEAWTTPFFEGLGGLLISPGRGLLLYFPGTVLCLWGLTRLWRRSAPAALFAALSMALFAVVYAKWYMWEGGWCWGPRFLIPVLPVFLLPVADVFAGMRKARPAVVVLVCLLVLASILVSASGVMVNYADYSASLEAHYGVNYYDPLRWSWEASPLVAYWGFESDYFLLKHALGAPGLILGLHVLFFIGLLLGLRGLIRSLRPAPRTP